MNILIIEDEVVLRKALSFRLTEWGHRVSVAGNGKEAIDVLDKNRDVNLIICDVMMPVLTGPSFILMLKKYFPKALPIVIIISVVKDAEEFLKKIEIHYDYFLSKPIDFDELKNILDRNSGKV